MELFEEGKLDRRIYWQLSRERLLPLLEYQELLTKHNNDMAIKIDKTGIMLVSAGGELYFNFSQPVCRAESVLLASENEHWDFVYKLLPTNGTFFDIGANVGWFSLNLHHVCPKAEIYAFEPVRTTFEEMEKNLILNGTMKLIHAINIGFYNQAGQQHFFVPAENEAASLRANEDPFYSQQGNIGQKEIKSELKEIVCDIDTIDEFVRSKNIKNVDFIKCDVEGAEKMTFEGGSKVLSEYQPIVYTEMLRKHAKRFGYHPNDIICMFEKWGYQCYQLVDDSRLELFESMDNDTTETNFFFLHKDKHRNLIELYTGYYRSEMF